MSGGLSNKKNTHGFTIIEVLIVLAIAGLIMLVVFLAVPALNRNSSNRSLKAEGSNIAAAYKEASHNKGGAALAAGVYSSTHTGASINDADRVFASAGTSRITKLSIIANAVGTDPAAQAPTKGDQALIVLNAACAAQNDPDPIAGNGRQVAVIFQLDVASGTTYVCVGA